MTPCEACSPIRKKSASPRQEKSFSFDQAPVDDKEPAIVKPILPVERLEQPKRDSFNASRKRPPLSILYSSISVPNHEIYQNKKKEP